MRYALAAIVFVATIGAAQADPMSSDATMMQRVLKKIETENRNCNVGMAYAGRISAKSDNNFTQFAGALLLIYSVDGCNGGNNWRYTAQVYGIKDDFAREIGRSQSWSIVKGADFNDERALIYAVDQGSEDGHCCPTQGKTVEVKFVNGQPIFRQIKSWYSKNN